MSFKNNGVSLIAAFLLLLLSSVIWAHDGHLDDDVVLSDLGYLGEVNFPISCHAEPQAAMNTGVALLHHMMYAQAEQLFKLWSEKAPQCAMMHWGYAMSLFHPLWPDKISSESLDNGLRALTKTQTLSVTEREKSYIDATKAFYRPGQSISEIKRVQDWVVAQASVFKQNPTDIDAKAFYALSLLVGASKEDKTYLANKKAGEILAEILLKQPSHPGAIHYSIHAYDNPVLAPLGVKPARAYDKIAPDVPHALHMPTHVFVRLGEWQDAVTWNMRSAKSALKYPTNDATSMHYVHALDYLVYSYLQLGEGKKAINVLQEIELHHPIQNAFPAAYALSAMPARVYLEQKLWREAREIKPRTPHYLSWEKFPQVEAITYFARGIGAARSGSLEAAALSIKVLDELHQKTVESSPQYWAPLVDAQRKSVSAWIAFAKGMKDSAITLQREAADIEDALDKNPVTPGSVLPARELLGDMLLLMGNKLEARQAYDESLKINPGRRYSIIGNK